MNPEDNKNTAGLTNSKKNTLGNIFSSALFYLTILFFIIGFNFSDVMVGNWYQQFMPNLNGEPVSDIFFLDSLTGFAVTGDGSPNDSNYILKTTNSGNNWGIVYTAYRDFFRIKFVNEVTGFACGGFNVVGGGLFKTTNAGENWNQINSPSIIEFRDMAVIDENTIWLVDDNSLNGGVYRTTDGGTSWQNQINLGSQNPNHIYFFNRRIGYICEDNTYLRKTTDGGANWNVIVGADGFRDLYFVDSLKGWKAYDSVKMTNNGGINWQTQILPSGFGIATLFATKFSHLNSDTIWLGGGRIIFPNSQGRGILFRTVNQGNNWLYQIPDTSIIAGIYSNVQFLDKYKGWANTGYVQIHTNTGGDPIWLTPVEQTSSEVPKDYMLNQNYPNPFNPATSIGFRIAKSGLVILKIFDIRGKETAVLINAELKPGEYKTEWNASGYSSGVYFYSLIINGVAIDTKRMILLK